MINSLLTVFSAIFSILKYPLIFICCFFAFFYVLVSIYYLYYRSFEGMQPIKGQRRVYKRPSIFKRLLWDAPKQIAKDRLRRNPETFGEQGIVIFTGYQGQGKTISMIEETRRLQYEYPLSKCLANLEYKKSDKVMESWDDIVEYQNEDGVHCGVICVNDELQNSFNSKKSKDFPMEYVAVVTQNRKNRRILLGTAQSFYMLAKDIRTQCTEVRMCNTFLGCITFVRCYRPCCDSSGEVIKMKYRRMYFFVQDDELRSSYDTYQVIMGMKKAGFKPRSEQASAIADKRNAPTVAVAE